MLQCKQLSQAWGICRWLCRLLHDKYILAHHFQYCQCVSLSVTTLPLLRHPLACLLLCWRLPLLLTSELYCSLFMTESLKQLPGKLNLLHFTIYCTWNVLLGRNASAAHTPIHGIWAMLAFVHCPTYQNHISFLHVGYYLFVNVGTIIQNTSYISEFMNGSWVPTKYWRGCYTLISDWHNLMIPWS